MDDLAQMTCICGWAACGGTDRAENQVSSQDEDLMKPSNNLNEV